MLAKTQELIARPLISFLILIIFLGVGVTMVQATLSNSDGVIEPPVLIDEDIDQPTNTRQQAFEERQQVLLQADVDCTYGQALAGDVVNSHLIFYNTDVLSPLIDADRVWEFGEEVVCVMSERSGLKQAQTDGLLGHPDTEYPGPFSGRGMENDGSDKYVVSGNTMTITMSAEPTGDWIRVLTKVSDVSGPEVYCELGSTPGGKTQDNKDDGKGNDSSKFLTLIGADDTDGAVDLYLFDTVSETEFGPFEAGTTVQLTEAKGAKPGQEAGKGEVDYKIKVNGATNITAVDSYGNKGEAVCSE